jgi:hypothetical protein
MVCPQDGRAALLVLGRPPARCGGESTTRLSSEQSGASSEYGVVVLRPAVEQMLLIPVVCME